MRKHTFEFNSQIMKIYQTDNKENIIACPNITFQITDNCNLCCSYCYQINKGHHIMPLEIAQKFIDLLIKNDNNTKQYIDTYQSKGIILDFIGGEPLLYPELIDDIITYFREQTIINNHPWQYNWRIGISTNGTLYFSEKVQNFIKKYNNNLSLSISIDGNEKLHDSCRKFPDGKGSYDLAITAARHYMNNYNSQIGSKMTLSPNNVQFTNDAIINLINENYKEINLNCIFEKGWELKHAIILYTELKKLANYLLDNNLEDEIYISMFNEDRYCPLPIENTSNWCGGNGSMLALDWKGDIYPCLRYMESSLGPNVEPIIIGNVNKGFMFNKKCKDCVKKLRQITRISQSTEECINCSIASGCSWCQAYNYQETGVLNKRVTNICIMHKAQSLANAYFWNLYYHKHNENTRFKIWLPDEEALKIISKEELDMLKTLEIN